MTSYSIHYSRRDAEREARETFALEVGPVEWSEDGQGWPVHTLRAFDIEGQSAPGYLGELREPFATETMGAMLDSMDDDE